MANGTIQGRKIIDIKFIKGDYGSSFSINGHTGISPSGKFTMPTTPNGYTEIFSGIEAMGNAGVLTTNPFNPNSWIYNANSSTATIQLRGYKFCVKYG